MTDFSNNYAAEALGTDSYGDLVMRNGDLVLTSDAQAGGTDNVLQDITMRLKTFLSEVFVDQTLGVPYFQQLLGQKTPASTWDAVLQNVVLQTPGVVQLTSWRSVADTRARTLHVTFSAVTSSGTVTYNQAVDLTG